MKNKNSIGYELNKLRAENNTLKHELRKWKEVKPGGSKMIALEEVCEAQQLELYEMKKWNETLAASLASAIEKHEAFLNNNKELTEFVMPEEPKPKRAPRKKVSVSG
jgi:FtsZ-binding cell division protein ZapB